MRNFADGVLQRNALEASVVGSMAEDLVEALQIINAMRLATEFGMQPYVHLVDDEEGTYKFKVYLNFQRGSGEYAVLDFYEVKDWLKSKLDEMIRKDRTLIANLPPDLDV